MPRQNGPVKSNQYRWKRQYGRDSPPDREYSSDTSRDWPPLTDIVVPIRYRGPSYAKVLSRASNLLYQPVLPVRAWSRGQYWLTPRTTACSLLSFLDYRIPP